MKKAILYTLLVGVLCVGNVPAAYAETPEALPVSILISEIQTAGTNDATEEFVELYNPGDISIDVTGWLLQYRAASGTATQTWPNSSTKATLACPTGSTPDCRVIIAPRQRIVATHTIANIAGALSMTGGFSSTGGQIRLVEPGAPLVIHDLVGYGNAIISEIAPAAAPAGGKSIKRIIDTEENPVDTNNNAADFINACGDPTPGLADTSFIPRATGCDAPPEPTPEAPTTPSENTGDTPTDTPTDQPGMGGTPTYLPVIITEVFADPESPQQDSTDEFIELYNPNDTAITLKDYRLQTGSEYRYTYTLGDTPLGPHTYLAIPSAVSKLSLANSGSGVRLIDPNGETAYEAPNYGDAKPGQSWMQDDTGWKWTLTPTPGGANTLTVPQPKVTATATAAKKKTTAKTTATKKATTKQAKAPAAKKAATPEIPKTQASQTATATNPQYWLLAPIGALAAGYAAYEYRQGISRGVRTGWAKVRGQEPPTEK
jgi:hypothetical protein